jgi:hypothetical protein
MNHTNHHNPTAVADSVAPNSKECSAKVELLFVNVFSIYFFVQIKVVPWASHIAAPKSKQ